MVTLILLGGLVAGAVVQFIPFTYPTDSDSINDAIMMGYQADGEGQSVARVLQSDLPFDFRLVALAHLATVSSAQESPELGPLNWIDAANPEQELEDAMAAMTSTPTESVFDTASEPSESEIAMELINSIVMSEVSPRLEKMAMDRPPVRHANQAIAAFHVSLRSLTTAARHFEIEGEFPDAKVARQFASIPTRMIAIRNRWHDWQRCPSTSR